MTIPTYEEAKQLHMNLGRSIDILNKDNNILRILLDRKERRLSKMVLKHRELGMLIFEQEDKIQVLKPKVPRTLGPRKKDPQTMSVAELTQHMNSLPEGEKKSFVENYLLKK